MCLPRFAASLLTAPILSARCVCTGRTRVSFDFRVIPFHLFQPPNALAARLSMHALDPGTSKRGYYAMAWPEARAQQSDDWDERERQRQEHEAQVAAQRRAWRERGARAADESDVLAR